MLSNEQLEFFGDDMAFLMQAFEQEVIGDIARRLKKTGRYTETAELMAGAMKEAGYSPAKIRNEVMHLIHADKKLKRAIAKETLLHKQNVKKKIIEMEREAYLTGDDIISKAGDMSFNYDLKVWKDAGKTLKKSDAIPIMIQSAKKLAKGNIKNLTRTTAFKVGNATLNLKNAYTRALNLGLMKMATGTFSYDTAVNDVVSEMARKVWKDAGKTLKKSDAIPIMIQSAKKLAKGNIKNLTRTTAFKVGNATLNLKNAYTRALNLGLMKMATGTFSYDTAVNDVVSEMARKGIRSIDYSSGKQYQLDTASRMILRTACHQLSSSISMENIESSDVDLVEVSSHWGARDSHAVWQGAIYSRNGKSKKYKSFDVCRYGAVDGLCGINCRHRFYPFFEGISEPNTWIPEPKPKEYNGKKYSYYEATQRQRELERTIRADKREIEALKNLEADYKLASRNLKKHVKEYKNFSYAMNISEKPNRTRVIKDVSEFKAYRKAENELQLKYDLQFFAKKLDKDEVLEELKNGLLSKEQFYKNKKAFEKIFKLGLETPIETVYNEEDRFYHIVSGHTDLALDDDFVEKIKSVLQSPDEVRETTDKFGKLGKTYIKKIDGESMIAVTRDSNIITSYIPNPPYMKNNIYIKKRIL